MRKFYKLTANYPPIREIIDREISKEVVQVLPGDGDDDMEDEQEDRIADDGNQPRYKVINHLTFLYEEIWCHLSFHDLYFLFFVHSHKQN